MKYVLGLIEGIDMIKCLLIATSFGRCKYKEKFEDKKKLLLYWLAYVGVISVWYFVFGDTTAGTICEYILGALFFQILMGGKLLRKIGWYLMSNVAVGVVGGLVSLILIISGRFIAVTNEPIIFILVEVGLLGIFISVVKLYERFITTWKSDKRENLVISLIGLTVFTADAVLIGESLIIATLPGVSKIGLLVLNVGAGVAILVMGFAAIVILRYGEKNRKKMQLSKEYLQLQHEYYTQSLEKDEKLRAFRHDFNHHIRLLDGMAESGKLQEVQEYIRQITKEQVSTIKEIHSGHITADAIFNDYAAKCAGNNIRFQVWGHFPPNFAISSYDLCTILANAMLNAFEAGMAIKQHNEEVKQDVILPEILVQIRGMDEQLNIQISNTALVQSEKRYYSNRDGIHGFGLQNIKSAVEKNGGYMNTRMEEDKFILSIIF